MPSSTAPIFPSPASSTDDPRRPDLATPLARKDPPRSLDTYGLCTLAFGAAALYTKVHAWAWLCVLFFMASLNTLNRRTADTQQLASLGGFVLMVALSADLLGCVPRIRSVFSAQGEVGGV